MNLTSVNSRIQIFEITSFGDEQFQRAMQEAEAAKEKSVVLWDLDETVMEPEAAVGTASSKEYLKRVFASMRLQKADLYDILTLVVSKRMPVKSVEKGTPELLRSLQDRGIRMLGYTARGKEQWRRSKIQGIAELTRCQLAQIEVDFSRGVNPFADAKENRHHPYAGIFFTADTPKGDYLKELFASSAFRPDRLYFVDDKRDQVDSVVRAASELGVPLTAFHYKCVDKSADSAKQDIAIMQLVKLVMDQQILSDEIAIAEAARFQGDTDRLLRETLILLDGISSDNPILAVADIERHLGMTPL